MKQSAIVFAAVLALVYARPETYRENEEFQYSRSSSDDGNKSGFYGAQRGNMGGNYEKAHNMDPLAQHQMSSVVSQVDGELGSGADTKTGSVFTAGNSRGMYGSGKYDLSNLRGRNFAEGTSYGNSQSSAFSQNSGYHGESYSASNNARYRNQQSQSTSQNSGYRGIGESSFLANQQEDDLQRVNSNQEYSNQAANNYRYHSQASSHGSSSYDQSVIDSSAASGSSAATGSDTFSGTSGSVGTRRYTAPIRLYVRPGARTTVPVSVHAYDASQFDSTHALTEQNQENFAESGTHTRPKHYESSYSYKKEWEKHDTQPLAVIPTENPFPKHSELYDSTQNLQQSSQSSDSAYQGYSSNAKYSNSHKSAYQSGYKTEGQHLAAGSNLQAYTADSHATKNAGEIGNLVGDIDSKPKSYQSSYSYHKSWERRGDPYVIIPTDNGQVAQRLTAASASDRYGQHLTHQHGSRYNYAKQGYSEDCDCDENGNIRVARSIDENEYQNYQQQNQDLFDLGQQQQSEWSNLEDLGQQTQNKWENFEQSAVPNKFDQLESLPKQYTQDQNLENLGQQTQNQWDNLEDLGQQTQSKWDNLESLSQKQENNNDNLENLGQQVQSKWDNLEDLGQQSQNKWVNIETLGQRQQNKVEDLEEVGQQTQNKWDQLEDLSQQSQKHDELFGNLGQQTQNVWGQNTQTNWNFENTNLHSQQDWKQQDGNTYHQHQYMSNNLQYSHNFNQNQPNYNWWRFPSTPHHVTGTSGQEQKSSDDNDHTNFWHTFEHGNDWAPQNNPQSFNHMSHIQHELQTNNPSPKTNDGSSLNSLWNKLDNIAGIDSIAGNVHEQTNMNSQSHHSSSNAQDLSSNWSDQHSANFWDIVQNENGELTNLFQHESESNADNNQNNDLKPQANIQEKSVSLHNSSDLEKPEEMHKEQNIHPVDVGRGDIDSEDISTASKDDIDFDKLFESNTHKSSQEIESLNKKRVHDDNLNGKDELSVLGIRQFTSDSNTQKHTDTVKITSTTTEKNTDQNKLNSFTQNLVSKSEGRENLPVENLHEETVADKDTEPKFMNKPFEDFGQISEGQAIQDTQPTQEFNINTFTVDNEDQQNQNLDSFPSGNDFQTHQDSKEQHTQTSWDTQQLQQFDQINTFGIDNKEQLNQNLDSFPSINAFQTQQDSDEQQVQNSWDTQQLQQFDQINTFGIDNKEQGNQNLDSFPSSNDLQTQKNINEHQAQTSDKQLLQQSEHINTFEIDNEEQQNQDLDSFPPGYDYQPRQNMKAQYPQISRNLQNDNDQQHSVLDIPQERNQKVTDLESIKKHDDEIIVPVEVTTAKPSFWKSIGNKFSNAKESVVSWFKS